MARLVLVQPDGSTKSWDDDTELYIETAPDGTELVRRAITPEECVMLNPVNAKMAEITEVVDQLILDQLMGGMF